jgi:hypothetical protein
MGDVHTVLFRSPEFRLGSPQSSWMATPSPMELMRKRALFVSLLRLFERLVCFGYLPNRHSVLRYYQR